MSVSTLNIGFVRIFCICETMYDWSNLRYKISSYQIHNFKVINCIILMGIAPRQVGRWIGYLPISIVELFVLHYPLKSPEDFEVESMEG